MTLESWGRSLLTGWILASSLLVLGACGDKAEEAPSRLRAVRTQVVYLEGGARTRTFAGVANAGLRSQLSFKVAGTAARVNVKVGDEVRSGQVIARLDPTDYELRVEDSEAALARQQATVRSAEATYRRAEALYENNNASLADLEVARTNFETATASLQSSRKALEQAQMQLSYTSLTAPVAGAISSVSVEEGENVQSGTPVAVLTAGDELEVEVAVSEQLIADIRRDQTVTVRFDATGDAEHAARVIEVGIAPEQGANTYPVTVRLERESSDLRPGMAAEVDFRFESRGGLELFVVPPGAVVEDNQGRYCFVVRDIEAGAGVARRVEATTGDLTEAGLQVLTGPRDGDHLVTAGVGQLVDGERVRLWAATGASGDSR